VKAGKLTLQGKHRILRALFNDYSLRSIRLANIASSAKRARQAEKRRQHNTSFRSRVRTYIKKVIKAIRSGDTEAAKAAYQAAVPVIDTSVNKGLIHKNNAARHKRRLSAHIKAMQQTG
jgi:small subunit ribosomal protein S20